MSAESSVVREHQILVRKTTTPATAEADNAATSPILIFLSLSVSSDQGFCLLPMAIPQLKPTANPISNQVAPRKNILTHLLSQLLTIPLFQETTLHCMKTLSPRQPSHIQLLAEHTRPVEIEDSGFFSLQRPPFHQALRAGSRSRIGFQKRISSP